MLKNLLSEIRVYFNETIWEIKPEELALPKRLWIHFLQICSLTFRRFDEENCYLHASALTFYSLLAIVPVLATAFAIAKGFGFEGGLEAQLRERFSDQKQVMEQAISFSRRLLEDAQGGIIGGVGILVMLWSVIKMLGNIENSFNEIWEIQKSRSLSRKFADYLAVVLICPIVFTTASSINFFLIGYFESAAEVGFILSKIGPVLLQALRFIPFILLWVVFSFLFLFMPNRSVSPISGLFAGFLTTILYLTAQWIYITFQIGVGQYGTIYGSFAALPLFLIWLQLSWVIVLGGAAFCAAFEKILILTEPLPRKLNVLRKSDSTSPPAVPASSQSIVVSGPGFTVTISPENVEISDG